MDIIKFPSRLREGLGEGESPFADALTLPRPLPQAGGGK